MPAELLAVVLAHDHHGVALMADPVEELRLGGEGRHGQEASEGEARKWLRAVLSKNIRCDSEEDNLVSRGGVYARLYRTQYADREPAAAGA